MRSRTKWKRQNQLRLDQLRQQSVEPQSADPSTDYGRHGKQQQQHRLLAAEPHHSRQEHRVYVPVADTDAEASTAAPSSAVAAFIGTPYQGVPNGARWNFLTTAAAIVRNVSYVHGCNM